MLTRDSRRNAVSYLFVPITTPFFPMENNFWVKRFRSQEREEWQVLCSLAVPLQVFQWSQCPALLHRVGHRERHDTIHADSPSFFSCQFPFRPRVKTPKMVAYTISCSVSTCMHQAEVLFELEWKFHILQCPASISRKDATVMTVIFHVRQRIVVLCLHCLLDPI